MIHKSTLLLVALPWLFAAAACVRGDAHAHVLQVALLAPGPVSDAGWNASAFEGLQRIEKELSATVRRVEVKAPSQFEGSFRDFASQGFDLIFGHGFEFSEPAARVAADFPATAFAVTSGAVVRENVSSIQFVIEQPAYLAGMLAAALSGKGKIGCLGGQEIPPVRSAFKAFEAGAKVLRPDATVVVSWIGSWEDVSSAKEGALALLDQGADLLFHDADAAGLGVITAAKERQVLAIGCNRNQNDVAPETVVASVVLDVPEAFVRIATEVKNGAHHGRLHEYDLKSGVVSLAWNERLASRVPAAARAKIEQAKHDLESGKLVLDRLH